MNDVLIQAGIYIGLVVVFFLIIAGKRNSNNILLGLSLFCIWYSLTINQLVLTEAIFRFPYLFRTGNITAYMILPFLYLYVRNGFYPGKLFGRYDWIFFIPAVLYVVDMLPFFLMPIAEKVAILKNNIVDPGQVFQISEGWIGIPGFHPIFRYVWSLSLLFLLFRLIYLNRALFNDNRESGNLPILFFKLALALLYLPLIIPGIYGAFFRSSWYSLSFISFSLALSLLASTLFLFFFPEVLKGFTPADKLLRKTHSGGLAKAIINKFSFSERQKPETESVESARDMNDKLKMIEKLVQDRGLFKNSKYSIHDLSKDTMIPAYQLSRLINQSQNKNFSGWLNQFRIEYFIEQCKNENNRNLTIKALSQEAGFSRKVNFLNAFKKETGKSPTEYIGSK